MGMRPHLENCDRPGSDYSRTNGTVFRHEKHREEMHELTVQLLIQGLHLPRLLDQADLVAVDVVVLGGAVHCDACERDGASVTFILLSRHYKGAGKQSNGRNPEEAAGSMFSPVQDLLLVVPVVNVPLCVCESQVKSVVNKHIQVTGY